MTTRCLVDATPHTPTDAHGPHAPITRTPSESHEPCRSSIYLSARACSEGPNGAVSNVLGKMPGVREDLGFPKFGAGQFLGRYWEREETRMPSAVNVGMEADTKKRVITALWRAPEGWLRYKEDG